MTIFSLSCDFEETWDNFGNLWKFTPDVNNDNFFRWCNFIFSLPPTVTFTKILWHIREKNQLKHENIYQSKYRNESTTDTLCTLPSNDIVFKFRSIFLSKYFWSAVVGDNNICIWWLKMRKNSTRVLRIWAMKHKRFTYIFHVLLMKFLVTCWDAWCFVRLLKRLNIIKKRTNFCLKHSRVVYTRKWMRSKWNLFSVVVACAENEFYESIFPQFSVLAVFFPEGKINSSCKDEGKSQKHSTERLIDESWDMETSPIKLTAYKLFQLYWISMKSNIIVDVLKMTTCDEMMK